jgi:hypothetical protein
MHQPDLALAAYRELDGLDPATVGGLPAGLVARAARCEILAELKRSRELAREAHALSLDLNAGRWKLTRASFIFYDQELGRWLGPRPAKRRTPQPASRVSPFRPPRNHFGKNGSAFGSGRRLHQAGALFGCMASPCSFCGEVLRSVWWAWSPDPAISGRTGAALLTPSNTKARE